MARITSGISSFFMAHSDHRGVPIVAAEWNAKASGLVPLDFWRQNALEGGLTEAGNEENEDSGSEEDGDGDNEANDENKDSGSEDEEEQE